MLSVKKRALVDNFSKDSKIPISTGLTRLFEDKALGGCTQAPGKGWNERVTSKKTEGAGADS